MADEFINFGDAVREPTGMQCQYAVRYLFGVTDYPNLGEGLRFAGEPGNYHGVTIHPDDASIFVARLNNYKKGLGLSCL